MGGYGFLAGLPFWQVYLALLGIILVRAQATYWIGRAIGAGVQRSGFAQRLGARLARAERLVGRYGPPAVTVSFLTVGLQTAVNLVAGAMRMRFPRYLVAMVVGSLVWALLYSLGGLAIIATWWDLFTRSPALAVAVAVIVVGAVAAAVIWRRARRQPRPEDV
ncbi:MAG TPA: VTT domain-containing protein [Streptosporangiaceae bacterium]|jgi:membrane protein DedA with SNARE-associated domain